MSVDLPALGNPTRATSAMSRSSRRSQRSSPYSPCSAKPGARRALDRKWALPRPACPPRAARTRSPDWTRSARTTPSRSRTIVPSGTGTTRSSPVAPVRLLPDPWAPDVARRWGWSRKAISEATLRSAASQTSPPLPPSPPSGPPRSTYGSRRKATAPAPPSPPRRLTIASSVKSDIGGSVYPDGARALLPWQDVDEAAAPAGAELDLAGGGGEERVVAAPADIVAGVELGAPLTDDDRASGHGGAVEDLHAEPLGRGVTAVAGGTGTLLLRHGETLQPLEIPVISIV